MKLSQLLKPRKPKKKPDPWFFGWGLSDTGGDTSVTEEVKVHKREDLPQRLHLAKSFYMVLTPSNVDGWSAYTVKQLLNETPVAEVVIFGVPNANECGWMFEPTKEFFPDYNGDDIEIMVSWSNLYNFQKLKWWVTNRLIELGALPPRSS